MEGIANYSISVAIAQQKRGILLIFWILRVIDMDTVTCDCIAVITRNPHPKLPPLSCLYKLHGEKKKTVEKRLM